MANVQVHFFAAITGSIVSGCLWSWELLQMMYIISENYIIIFAYYMH